MTEREKKDLGCWRCYTSAVCQLPFCLDKGAHRVPWDCALIRPRQSDTNQKWVFQRSFLKAMCVSPPALFLSLPMFSQPLWLERYNSSTLFFRA